MRNTELDAWAEVIELILTKLVEMTQSQSEMLKIVKIVTSRVLRKSIPKEKMYEPSSRTHRYRNET